MPPACSVFAGCQVNHPITAQGGVGDTAACVRRLLSLAPISRLASGIECAAIRHVFFETTPSTHFCQNIPSRKTVKVTKESVCLSLCMSTSKERNDSNDWFWTSTSHNYDFPRFSKSQQIKVFNMPVEESIDTLVYLFHHFFRLSFSICVKLRSVSNTLITFRW